MAAIFFIGILNLYSATYNQSTSGLYKAQMLYFILSMMVGFAVSLINSKNFYRIAYYFYAINVFLLILVLVLGKVGMGAQRWLSFGVIRFQPSEFMKLSLVFVLARWFSGNSPYDEISFKQLVVPGVLTFIPAILIIAQPDLGTGLILLLIFSMIIYYRKLKWSAIFKVVLLAALAGSVMYKFGLKEYQRKRIQTFINPYQDAKGSGYNAIQSEIAIGSGRIFGKGYLKSSQASLNFLPENHTDFVFSIFNEEHGLFGSILLIMLYCILFLRFLWLARSVTNVFDSVFCVGLMAIFFWHTFINMAMVSGLLPIVGLPLPFMSYGGSSLITFGICIGLATSISNSRSIF